MNCNLNIIFTFFLLLVMAAPACSQSDDGPINDTLLGVVDSSAVRKYKFIRFSLNRFVFPNKESKAFEKFYARFDSLTNYDGKDVAIYHIGGSHIQADIYTNEFRKHIQDFGPGLKGSRGWLFPYSMVGTNNPSHYRVESIGEWKGVFNTMRKDSSTLGLMGLAAVTYDSLSSVRIFFRKPEQRYYSNRVRVYHNTNVSSYRVTWIYPDAVKSSRVDVPGGYTEIILKQPVDTVSLNFVKVIDDTSQFRLYGMQLMIDEPGLIYSTIGVNGASLSSYNKCRLFGEQLKQLKPDMFIISIGTNDANVDVFNVEEFERKYTELLETIQSANPNVALLLSVPNDAYYFKRYPNRHVSTLRDAIYRLAKKYDAGVWDFYDIMGGFGSSQTWYKNELMHKDRVHFTFEGYKIKGDLFYEAFLKFLDEYEFNRLVKITNK